MVEDSNRPAMSPLAYREVTHPWHRSTRLRAKVRALAVSLSRSLRVATSSIIAGTGDYRCRRPGRGGGTTHTRIQGSPLR